MPRSSREGSETNSAVRAGRPRQPAAEAELRARGELAGDRGPCPGGGGRGDGVWCRGAEAVCPCRRQALLYGDTEKPVETGARAAPGAAEPRPACTCDKKPCGCQKAEVNYAFLHSTGNDAPGPGHVSPTNTKQRFGRKIASARGARRPVGPEVCGGSADLRAPSPGPLQHLPGTRGRWVFIKPAKKNNPTPKQKKILKTKAIKSQRAIACRLLFLRNSDSSDLLVEVPAM